jgi:hypothetical protein
MSIPPRFDPGSTRRGDVSCPASSPTYVRLSPSESLELAVDRAANLESGSKVTILGVVGPDGYAVFDREEYIRLLREKSGRQ